MADFKVLSSVSSPKPNMVLAPGFTCSEASHDEQPQVWEMFSKSYAKDEHWKAIMENIVEPDKFQPWILQVFSLLWTLPDKTIYKITEDSSGKIVAWTTLQHPWTYVDTMTAEMKEHSNSDELPPPLEGMNVETLKEQLKALEAADKLGYNPENDYHRKGNIRASGLPKATIRDVSDKALQ